MSVASEAGVMYTAQYTVQLVHGKLWQSLWTASNYLPQTLPKAPSWEGKVIFCQISFIETIYQNYGI